MIKNKITKSIMFSILPNISRILIVGLLLGMGGVGFAQNATKGSVTKLPIPRFVSLKSKPSNLRVGPGKEYPVAWTFLKAGVPLEVIQEFEHWRRVRDSEGAEGWIFHALLSAERKAVVAPWDKGQSERLVMAYQAPNENSGLMVKIEPNVVVVIENCHETWCQINLKSGDDSIAAYVQKEFLWGVYPDEEIK